MSKIAYLTHDSAGDDAPGSAVDRRAVAAAMRKVATGEELTSREQSLLRRYEKERDETLRWKHYRSIPQKHWRAMSGRQSKVLNEQAALYGIPLGGPTVNLSEVVRSLHDFLANNARKLAMDDDLLGSGVPSPALERYREERAIIAKLDRQERERQLVRRDDVRTGLARIAHLIQAAGDLLERQFGPSAAEILAEALADAEREIDRWFGNEPPPITELESTDGSHDDSHN